MSKDKQRREPKKPKKSKQVAKPVITAVPREPARDTSTDQK